MFTNVDVAAHSTGEKAAKLVTAVRQQHFKCEPLEISDEELRHLKMIFFQPCPSAFCA